ncbi:MAG: chromate transporter, partial [Verrucomicrobia bacterium]|nr:chromate transporter [Verrucomicrobiota bacterium]
MTPSTNGAAITQGFARGNYLEIFLVFLRLGLTSFGGPIAHLGYFRQEFVDRRKWLTEEIFADLVALCNFLPGPTSSQVSYSIGMTRG